MEIKTAENARGNWKSGLMEQKWASIPPLAGYSDPAMPLEAARAETLHKPLSMVNFQGNFI